MQDVAIAYGYNNITRTEPRAVCQGRQQPLNQLSDLLRAEVAQAGFTEILTFALVSRQENFEFVNLRDGGDTAVIIGNPRTSDFEAVRTSLLPGVLKTMGHNKDAARPLKVRPLRGMCTPKVCPLKEWAYQGTATARTAQSRHGLPTQGTPTQVTGMS